MRTILLASILLFPASAFSQQTAPPPSGANWNRVEALPAGTALAVQAQKRHALCTLQSATEEALTCAPTDVVFHSAPLVFQRAEIRRIKLNRRNRSGIEGGLIGMGAGAAIGAGAGVGSTRFSGYRGAYPLIFGFVGLFTGAPIGYFANFAGSTVYKAP